VKIEPQPHLCAPGVGLDKRLSVAGITAQERDPVAPGAGNRNGRRLFFAEDGTVIDTNKAFLQMTGYSRAEIDARELTWREMTPPEWVAVTKEQLDKLERSGHLGPYEKEYLCKMVRAAGCSLPDGNSMTHCRRVLHRHQRPKRAEGSGSCLSRELSHRVKNTLAIVEALALQTTGKSVEEFRDKFGAVCRIKLPTWTDTRRSP